MLDPMLPITCPGCGRKFDKRTSSLTNNARITCPGCGKPITIKGGTDKMMGAFKALQDSLRKAGFKRR